MGEHRIKDNKLKKPNPQATEEEKARLEKLGVAICKVCERPSQWKEKTGNQSWDPISQKNTDDWVWKTCPLQYDKKDGFLKHSVCQ